MLRISWLYSRSPGWFNVRKTCWRYYRTTWKVISLYLQDQNMLMREPTLLGHTLDDYSPLSQFPNSSVEKEKWMDFMISFGGYLTKGKTCILGQSFVGSWIFHILQEGAEELQVQPPVWVFGELLNLSPTMSRSLWCRAKTQCWHHESLEQFCLIWFTRRAAEVFELVENQCQTQPSPSFQNHLKRYYNRFNKIKHLLMLKKKT